LEPGLLRLVRIIGWSWRGFPPVNSNPLWYREEQSMMKTWSVIGLLLTAAIIAAMPISLQVTLRGLELGVSQAQAVYYGHYRRGYRRAYRRGYYYGGSGYFYGGQQPIGGGGGQRHPW
jgi:hypothetical protein